MIFGFNKSKKQNNDASNRKINKNIEGIMKDLKKKRVIECQNIGMSVSKMGKDLAFLDKKIKSLYNEAIKQLKSGKSHNEAYDHLKQNTASSNMEREIIDKIFSGK